jgi:hypothetical protein
VKSILYIGEDQDVLDRFQSADVDFHHVKNVVGFHNQLTSVDQYDLVVSEYQLKGVRGDGIFERYKGLLNQKRIPFSILDENLDLGKRKRLLKLD